MFMMWNGQKGFWRRCAGFCELWVKDQQDKTIRLKNQIKRRCLLLLVSGCILGRLGAIGYNGNYREHNNQILKECN